MYHSRLGAQLFHELACRLNLDASLPGRRLGCFDYLESRLDIDPERIAEANANAKKAGVEKLVRFQEADLFKANIHEATVVTLFLLSSVNLKLRPKLLAELKPGTRIVSNTFDMGDWQPAQELDLGGSDDNYFSRKLMLWIVPERNNGSKK